jgi:energy-coupling factor transporter ATP-binding protein EcfA2
MKKITDIYFQHYRAFYGNENNHLHIPEGKSVFIYGENGSGKSSVFKGIKAFFAAANLSSEPEKSPKHLHAETSDTYSIKLVFDNEKDKALLWNNGAAITETFVTETFKLNSFLSYQELLRTHLLEQVHFDEMFFELVVNKLLVNYKVGQSTFGKLQEDILKLFDSSIKEDIKKGQEKLVVFRELLEKGEDIKKINQICQSILDSFNQGLKINIEPYKTEVEEGKIKGYIRLNISYMGKENIPHLEILNEARLSSLALSIYFAAILANPIKADIAYRILFLDDIFIGLDTSNRIPLLEILKKEFSDFQIFITTYDRSWYKVAEKYLPKENWQFVEMYEQEIRNDKDEILRYEPLIMSAKNDYEKAKSFFAIKEYAACGNHLRSACENEMKKKMPAYVLQESDTLIPIFTKLQTFYKNIGKFPKLESHLGNIELLTSAVLNTLSHDNPYSPIYKTELEMAFTLVENLGKLPNVSLLLKMGAILDYQNTKYAYDSQIEAVQDIYLLKWLEKGQEEKIIIGNFRILAWQYEKIPFFDSKTQESMESTKRKAFCLKNCKMKDFQKLIAHSLNEDEAENDFYDKISMNGKSLNEMFGGI